jgi:hypothetical protein
MRRDYHKNTEISRSRSRNISNYPRALAQSRKRLQLRPGL